MIFRKKQKQTSNRNVSLNRTSSVPITRYYRSQQSGSATQTTEGLSKRRSSNNDTPGKRRLFDATTILTSVCISAVFVFALLLTGSPVVRITNGDSLYRNQQEYIDAANMLVNQSPFLRTKLTAQSSSLEKELLEKFPELDTVTVVVPLAGQRLQIGLKLHEPALLIVQQNGQQGIVSEDGVIVYKTDEVWDLPKITVIPQGQLDSGETIMTKEEVDFVQLVDAEFSSDNNRTFRLPRVDRYELDIAKNELIVRFYDASYIVRLNTQSDQREQVASVLALYKDIEQGIVAPPTEYIDARVPGRLFLK